MAQGAEGYFLYYKIINRKKRLATRLGDILGKVVFFPGMPWRIPKRPIPDSVQKILVIRTAYIGDVILTLPVLGPLKRLFPHADISFLTSRRAKEILDTNPYVNQIISYDAFWFYQTSGCSALADYLRLRRWIRSESYDLVIEARGDIRDIFLLAYPTGSRCRVSYDVGGGGLFLTHVVPFKKIKHKIEYHMDIVRELGGKETSVEWDLYLTRGETEWAVRMLAEKGVPLERPIVAIHPGGRKALKRWRPEGFGTVAERLSDELGASILILGGPDDVGMAKKVANSSRCRSFMLAGETTLRSMAAILKKCDLFIGNDSCALHVASMVGVPTVAIFGPSKSIETGPFGTTHRVVEKDFPCRYTCDEDVCHCGEHNSCMKSILEVDVFRAAREVFVQGRGGIVDRRSDGL
jgi:lipopolysaccharide heptosyltransferase II